jgi:hypothetical protein
MYSYKTDFRLFPAVVAATVVAYTAGEQLRYSDPSPAPSRILNFAAGAGSTGTISAVMLLNPTSFARIDPPPPIVPPGDRHQQG